MVKLKGWYGGVNSAEDIEKSGADAFKFHSTFKSLMRMVIAAISRIKTPQPWVDGIDGNMGVIRDIYLEYLEHENQTQRPGESSPLRADQDRKSIISTLFPFSLCVCFYDPNYTEVANWILFRICQEYDEGKFVFSPYHCLPEAWYQDEKGRMLPDAQKAMEFMRQYGKKRSPSPGVCETENYR